MRSFFPHCNPLQIDPDLSLDAAVIWKILSPLLTDARRRKILDVVQRRIFGCTIILESLYDRGNISAVFRSAEAFGLAHLHLIQSEKFKDSQRTSAGSEKWLEIEKFQTTAGSFAKLRAQGKKIYVTALSPSAVPISEINFETPCALLFGNELRGASDEALAEADEHVIIPMRGFVQSFNISVASALCFQTIAARVGSDVTSDEQAVLLAHYALRTLDSASSVLRRTCL